MMADTQNPIRLNSFADLHAVKGAIKTAPILAVGNGPVTKVEVGATVKIPQITAEDSVDSVVIKFIRENPNLNEDEIVGALNPILQMPDKITAALAQLYRAGLVMQTPVLVDGTTLTVYRAKHSALIDLARAQNSPSVVPVKPFKLPEVAILDPNGRIIYEQGLDIAIWKIMQDREWRSIDDIGALLHTYGFHAYTVKTRVKTLHDVGSGGVRWFDTTRKNAQRHKTRGTFFKLRIGVDCPKLGILSVGSGVAAEEEKSGDAAVDAILSGNSVFSMKPMDPATPVPNVEAATTKEVVVSTDTAVRTGDHFPVVLWKVMVGKKDLRVKALSELVAPYGFESGQVSSTMSAWLKEGYVTRVDRKEETDTKPAGFYTLVDMDMPAFPKGARSRYAVLPEGQAEPAPVATAAVAEPDSAAIYDFTQPIQEGDAIMTCIVKLMVQAGEPVSATDITDAMANWGFDRIPAYDALRHLKAREIVLQMDPGSRKSLYQLATVELPAFPTHGRTPVAKRSATVEVTVVKGAEPQAAEAQPAQASLLPEAPTAMGQAFKESETLIAETQPEPLDAYLEQREAQRAQQAQANAPLVRHLVMIKGVEFTLQEIDQIVAEMNTLKLFAWVGMSVRTVKAKFEIKGVELTPEELNEVLLSMK